MDKVNLYKREKFKKMRARKGEEEIIELVIYRGDEQECAWLDLYVQENCKGLQEDPRVTLCKSREQMEQTLQLLSTCGRERIQDALFFRAQERTYLLRVEDVRCFTGRNHKVHAILRDGTALESVTQRVTTAEFLKPLLTSGKLLHISRTTYVNPACVRAIEAKQLYLDDGTVLSISRNSYQNAVAALEHMTAP